MKWCRNEKIRGEKFCVSNHGIEQHNCEISRKKLKRADNHLAYLSSNRDVKESFYRKLTTRGSKYGKKNHRVKHSTAILDTKMIGIAKIETAWRR